MLDKFFYKNHFFTVSVKTDRHGRSPFFYSRLPFKRRRVYFKYHTRYIN